MNDREALLAIQDLLDGTEWSNETLEQVADIMREAGYAIRDVDAYEAGRIERAAEADKIDGYDRDDLGESPDY